MIIKKYFALLSAVLISVSLTGCSKSTAYKTPVRGSSADDASWKTAGEEVITLENDSIRLVFDSKTTHFTVENKNNGIKFYSYFNEESSSTYSADTQKRMNSEMTIVYYEEQSSAQYMFSDTDSVTAGHYRVTYNGNSIRVVYTFGEDENDALVPQVVSEKKMDDLLELMQNDSNPDGAAMSRRMMRFYTLYTADEADKGIIKAYPAIKKTPLYILNDDAGESDKEEIREYMALIGYTQANYAADISDLGLNSEQQSNTPGFIIPVEYSLQTDGFTARVLTDRIEEASSDYKLQSLTFLEYFASSENSNGQFFVPDGSGAVIDWSKNHVSTYSQPFYGSDYSIQSDKMTQLSQNSCLPVYGILRPSGAVMTIIEEGSENGTFYAESPDCSAAPNHIYTMFTMRHMDTTDIGADQLIPVYNLFVEKLSSAFPTQRFILLGSDESSWQTMAKVYRSYLSDNNGIRKTDSAENPDIYLTYWGMALKSSNFLGIPYDKKIVLSTLDDISRDIDTLISDGNIGAAVRLNGFSRNGLTPKANNRFSLSGKLGNKNELSKLQEKLQNSGGKLYTDGSFQFVYDTGNGFSKKTDSAHYLNRVPVKRESYDPVTRAFNSGKDIPYFLSPKQYFNYASGYLRGIEKTLGKNPAVSFGTLGKYLGGDYTTHTPVSRTDALMTVQAVLENARSAAESMSFDTGNAYVLPYADDIYNIPLNSSRFDAETTAVPFYPMVIHGLVPYCGEAINFSYDRNEQILRSLEYGAVLSYAVIGKDDSELTGTSIGSLYYSMNSDSNLKEFISLWQRIGAFQRKTANQEIAEHISLGENIFCTVYADQSRAYVNYSDKDYNADGITVKAHDFTLISAERS